LGDQFPRAAKWAPLAQAGHWPDADMLAVGYLGPAPGWGKARESRLTHDEQRSLLSLWSIARSPLMVGANLPKSDAWTTSLLTNPEVIAVDQNSNENHPVISTDATVVWTAQAGSGGGQYVAIFNLRAGEQKAHYEWRDIGLKGGAKRQVRELWERKDLGSAESLNVTLAAHGCALYRVSN